MSKFAIGDIQGHYDVLMRLLDKLDFSELWLVGDVVNRGPQSLEVLRFLMSMGDKVKMVLGNHDLHLLNYAYQEKASLRPGDTLEEVLHADDRDEIFAWLRKKPFLHEDRHLNMVMVHAGIAPFWTMDQARQYAKELQEFCQTPAFFDWLKVFRFRLNIVWSEELQGFDRMQMICNYLTQMRYVTRTGQLDWRSHQGLSHTPADSYPWFACPIRQNWQETIVFGHWASLLGKTGLRQFQAIDTACHWGGALSALNLETLARVSST